MVNIIFLGKHSHCPLFLYSKYSSDAKLGPNAVDFSNNSGVAVCALPVLSLLTF